MHKTTKIAGCFISHIHFYNSFKSVHFKQTNLEQIKILKLVPIPIATVSQ